MKVNVSMVFDIDEKDYDALKRIEHHAEELLNLQEWPEIKNVSDVRVKEDDGITREDVFGVLHDYVSNDYDGCADGVYIAEALSAAGVGIDDLEKYGFGWVKDLVDTEEALLDV